MSTIDSAISTFAATESAILDTIKTGITALNETIATFNASAGATTLDAASAGLLASIVTQSQALAASLPAPATPAV